MDLLKDKNDHLLKSKATAVSKQLPVSLTLPVTCDIMQRAAKMTLAIHPVQQHFRPRVKQSCFNGKLQVSLLAQYAV